MGKYLTSASRASSNSTKPNPGGLRATHTLTYFGASGTTTPQKKGEKKKEKVLVKRSSQRAQKGRKDSLSFPNFAKALSRSSFSIDTPTLSPDTNRFILLCIWKPKQKKKAKNV
jgi:hypothetical protein